MKIQTQCDQEVIQQLFEKGVLMEHDKRRSTKPHLLFNGRGHANSYCHARRLPQFPELMNQLCESLYLLDESAPNGNSVLYKGVGFPDGFVTLLGIATGGICVAKGLYTATVIHDHATLHPEWGYAKRVDRANNVWIINDVSVARLQDSRVILCDDVLTTGETVSALARFLKEHYGITVERDVFCIFDRTQAALPEINPIGLIRVEDKVYSPESCPMCARGSVAISPNEPGALEKIFGKVAR